MFILPRAGREERDARGSGEGKGAVPGRRGGAREVPKRHAREGEGSGAHREGRPFDAQGGAFASQVTFELHVGGYSKKREQVTFFV